MSARECACNATYDDAERKVEEIGVAAQHGDADQERHDGEDQTRDLNE